MTWTLSKSMAEPYQLHHGLKHRLSYMYLICEAPMLSLSTDFDIDMLARADSH